MQKELAIKLTQYLERQRLSQIEFGRLANVSQPVISRILNENWQRVTPSVERVAGMIHFKIDTAVDPRTSERLMKALSKVWDGSRRSEIAIAKVIEGVGHLI